MRSIRGAELLFLSLAAAACGRGTTEPAVPAGLNGNFGITNSTGFWLGLTLHESGGVVTGTGWSGDLMRLRQGITVTGTWQPPQVHLNLLQRQNGVTGRFDGTFERDTLRGIYELEPAMKPFLELTRVDTVPTGHYELHLTGDITGDFTGEGVFIHFPSQHVVGLSLDTNPFLWRFGISWENIARPPVGAYPLSSAANARPRAAFGIEGFGFQHFPFVAGTFTLDVSTRWAMIGHFEFTATNPATGGIVTARGTFNTGCQGVAC